MEHRGHILLLPPNRVWRTYPGGATLDRLEGKASPADTHWAEDWIGSVTQSLIPGREHLREGISTAIAGGKSYDLKSLMELDPSYFLGPAHLTRHGNAPMLLVKFLDSSLRLHFQCHPSRDFARTHLGSPSGKTEAYHILGIREGERDPFIYMGFQHPPSREELRRMIEEQDVSAMESCFERIPVAVGDTFLIPGGFPHALGGGVFMVEIQEPTDFAVRYEFERAGYILPEAARFMGKGIDFGLSLIDFTRRPVLEIERDYRCRPAPLKQLGPESTQDILIGPTKTQCFQVQRTLLGRPVTKAEPLFHIGIVIEGACSVSTERGTHQLNRYDRFLCPAGLNVTYKPEGRCSILECLPPS